MKQTVDDFIRDLRNCYSGDDIVISAELEIQPAEPEEEDEDGD